MAFDGLTVHYALEALKPQIEGGRLQKLYQLNAQEFIWQFHQQKKLWVFLSLDAQHARIHPLVDRLEPPQEPPLFTRVLRKHLEGARCVSIAQHGHDRSLQFTFQNRNDLGDLATYFVYAELFGKDANLILTDGDQRIIDCLKTNSPLEGTQRTMMPGAIYRTPDDERINPWEPNALKPFDHSPHDDVAFYLKQLSGLSPAFIQAVIHQAKVSQMPFSEALTKRLKDPQWAAIHDGAKVHPVLALSPHETRPFETFASFEAWAQQYHEQIQLTPHSSPLRKQLHQSITRALKKSEQRLKHLKKDLIESEKADAVRLKGSLLMGLPERHHKGHKQISLPDYTTQEPIDIPLNETKTLQQNAQLYFKKAKKLTTSKSHLEREIKRASQEIDYFQLLWVQWHDADHKTLEETHQELIQLGYLPPIKHKRFKTPKNPFRMYVDADGIEHWVGKNNLQNAALTHEIGHPEEWWFHTQDVAGAHVLVRSTQDVLSENTLRTAAVLAAYYSRSKDSSSVPVDYTRVKHVKKIPGKHGCFVRYSQQKTLYIDPDVALIQALKEKTT
jgi:predicted ribosome quality control (RQC) complex YloA/Tae2 family protein